MVAPRHDARASRPSRIVGSSHLPAIASRQCAPDRAALPAPPHVLSQATPLRRRPLALLGRRAGTVGAEARLAHLAAPANVGFSSVCPYSFASQRCIPFLARGRCQLSARSTGNRRPTMWKLGSLNSSFMRHASAAAAPGAARPSANATPPATAAMSDARGCWRWYVMSDGSVTTIPAARLAARRCRTEFVLLEACWGYTSYWCGSARRVTSSWLHCRCE